MVSSSCNLSDQLITELLETYPLLVNCQESLIVSVDLLVNCYMTGGKVLVCGNGGSASDSEHIVGELMKSFRMARPVDVEFARAYSSLFSEHAPTWLQGALPAISLVSHTSLITAFANDECAEGVFAQQVYGYGRSGDVLWCISTSGGSANVVEAAKVAIAKGMKVIALTGDRDTELTDLATASIKAPAVQTAAVQELHLPIYHCICASVERRLFGSEKDV